MSKIDPITEFQGSYRFLSNFWPAIVYLDGVRYPSVEHAYQAASAPTPGSAKKRAREIPAEYRRRAWNVTNIETMRDLLWQKFEQGELRRKLLDAGNRELIEGNAWGDTFWGVCNGKGQNRLGKLLMEIRAEIAASGR